MFVREKEINLLSSLFALTQPGDADTAAIDTSYARTAHLNPDIVAQLQDATLPAAGMRLGLFDNHDYTLVTTAHDQIDANRVNWRGHLPGTPSVWACITVVARPGEPVAVAGYMVSGRQRFVVTPCGDGQVRIALSREHLTSSTCGTHAPGRVMTLFSEGQQAAIAQEYAQARTLADTGVIAPIRVVALYSPRVVTVMGGQSALEASLQLASSLATESFQRSQIPARVEVVLQEETLLKGSPYNDSHPKDLYDDVYGLNYQAFGRSKDQDYPGQPEIKPDGALVNAIEAALKKTNADIAALIAPFTLGLYGLAADIPQPPTTHHLLLKSRVFTVGLTSKDQEANPVHLVEFNVFTHEIGHLMGAMHDRFTMPQRYGDPQYDYVRGYVSEDRTLVTVMGYPHYDYDSERLDLFSSPTLNYRGRPLGIPIGQTHAADSCTFLRESVHVVARYKNAAADTTDHFTLQLKVSPALGGMIQPDTLGPYPKGTQVRVKAQPRAGGYKFLLWDMDGVKVDSWRADEAIVTMDKDHTLTAIFDAAQAEHSVTVKASIPEAQSLFGVTPKAPTNGKYPDGTSIFVTNTSAVEGSPDYALLAWRVDGHLADATPTLNLEVYRDHQIDAVVGKRIHTVRWRMVPEFSPGIQMIVADGFTDGSISIEMLMRDTYKMADGQALRLIAQGGVFDHWRINGKDTTDVIRDLNIPAVSSDMVIEACMQGWETALSLKITTNRFDLYPTEHDFMITVFQNEVRVMPGTIITKDLSRVFRIAPNSRVYLWIYAPQGTGDQRYPTHVYANGKPLAQVPRKPGEMQDTNMWILDMKEDTVVKAEYVKAVS
jgi:hypothetical protein